MATDETGASRGSALDAGEPPTFNGRPMEPIAPGHEAKQKEVYQLVIRLHVIPVDVPFGTVSRSERLWRYLDEEIGNVPMSTALNRNGLRVGRGRVEDWPPVGELLREMAGQSLSRNHYLMQPGDGIPLVLQKRDQVQPIFAFDSLGYLHGLDYPAGENVLMVACHLNVENLEQVILQATPLVRAERLVPTPVKTPHGWGWDREPLRVPIGWTEFTLRVPVGDYVVIGPGAASARTTSPARHFLIGMREGQRYESLLVLVPEVWAAPIRQESL